jgi:hypothetical protein
LFTINHQWALSYHGTIALLSGQIFSTAIYIFENFLKMSRLINTLGAGVPPPQFDPNIKNHPTKSGRDNDMKYVVIDSMRRELLIKNKKNATPSQFFLSIH